MTTILPIKPSMYYYDIVAYFTRPTKTNNWERIYAFDVIPKSICRPSIVYGGVNPQLDYNNKCYCRNFQIFDLTLMFGEGNEPTTMEDFLRRIGAKTIEDIPIIECTEV